MFSSIVAIVFATTICSISAAPIAGRAPVPYFAPNQGGGSQLNNAGGGVGEPLNVIISGLSDPKVLTDSGFLNWAQSVQMSFECFGFHLGDPQSANLGDGNGAVNQTMELREDFGNADAGTCLETLIGRNHLRMFRQNGPNQNTGALFLAVSQELDLSHQHTIAANGYNFGRDRLVSLATSSGTTSHAGVTYSTTKETITGLLPSGTQGVNHGIAQDGNVILLTISIVS